MKITIGQTGKVYNIDNDNKLTIKHSHDAIISVGDGYFKNKYTGEWVNQDEIMPDIEKEKIGFDIWLEELIKQNGLTEY